MADERNCGLYRKFDVERLDGRSDPGEKHKDCEYFMLDLDHDPFARFALGAYALECGQEYPHLAADLRAKAEELRVKVYEPRRSSPIVGWQKFQEEFLATAAKESSDPPAPAEFARAAYYQGLLDGDCLMRVPEEVHRDEDKIHALGECSGSLTVWESDFVDDLDTRIEAGGHVSEGTSLKLDEIYRRRVLGNSDA